LSRFDKLSVTKDFKLNVSLSQLVLSLSKGRLTKNLPNFLSILLSRFDKLSVTICLNFNVSVTKDFKPNVSLSQLVLSLSKACSEPVEEGRLTKNRSYFLSILSSRFDKLSVTKDFKFNVSLSQLVLSLSKGRLTKNLPKFLSSFFVTLRQAQRDNMFKL
jgi:hypothetical protein